MIRPESVIESWKGVRADTIAAVEEFPQGGGAFKPVDDLASFDEIARHILDAGHILTGMLLDGWEVFKGPEFREAIPRYSAPPGPPLDGLRGLFEPRLAELLARDAAFWAGEVTRVDGARCTRLEMLQWVKEHELVHRQQLFMYLRLKGLVPPTTRRRQKKH